VRYCSCLAVLQTLAEATLSGSSTAAAFWMLSKLLRSLLHLMCVLQAHLQLWLNLSSSCAWPLVSCALMEYSALLKAKSSCCCVMPGTSS
jgi:hypothetical protein